MTKSILLPFLLVVLLLISIKSKAQNIPEQDILQQSEILWDTWDVPHIYAESSPAIGYGFGWAQMKSYSNEILKLYGLARGRGAEFWGEKYLPSDRLLHRVGIPGAAADIMTKQSPELMKYLEAFADGMNAYASKYPREINDDVKVVLPVEAEDLIRHSQRLFFTFASLTGNSRPIVGLNGLPPGTHPGSNTIAIGPSRSQSGNAMLLQNPHLPLNLPFMRFYEAHLIGPDFDLYGTTIIGTPLIIIGFNEQIGWSHTVNTADILDTYLLKVQSNGYQFDGKTLAFEEETKIIKLLREDGSIVNDTLKIKSSIHGPVIQSTDSSAIAVRTPMLDQTQTLQQYWEMGSAKNFEQFQNAVSQLQIPMFTTTYADRDGHIYYLFNGQIPKRPKGDFEFWQQTVAGDTSGTLWNEVHSFEDLPSLLDPVSGFVQNSNSPPWFATLPSVLQPEDYPAYLAPEWLLPREQRGLQMLQSDESISFQDLLEIRYSNRMLLADQVIDDLLPAARTSGDSLTRAAAEVLADWDRHTNPDSRGAVLFAFWAGQSCKGRPGDFCNFAEVWNPDQPITTPNGLADPEAGAITLGEVARKVQEQFGRLDVPWGDVMRLSEDIPGVGAPGDPFGVYHVMTYQPSEKAGFRPVHGDTWVAVIEFTKEGPKAEVLLTYGNSNGADSRQLKLLSKQEMRPVWNTRELIEKNLKSTTKYQY